MPLIDLGAKAPAFTLLDQDAKKRTLKEFLGSPLILYFYPKADTSSCTKEACAFNEALPKLSKLGVQVVGVSPDEPKALKKFADKYALKFPLLGDPFKEGATPETLDAFGVWGEKSMYGRTYMGVIRTTYVLDAKGKVAARFDNVKVPGHDKAVLETVAALKK